MITSIRNGYMNNSHIILGYGLIKDKEMHRYIQLYEPDLVSLHNDIGSGKNIVELKFLDLYEFKNHEVEPIATSVMFSSDRLLTFNPRERKSPPLYIYSLTLL